MTSAPRSAGPLRTPPWLALLLAAGAVGPAGGQDLVEHVVQRGDTLVGLLVPGAPWQRVQRDNRVADPRRLRPGSTLRIPLVWLREQPVQAEVVHTFGGVTVQRRGQDAVAALVGGDRLEGGDRLRTGANGSATLRFVDGSVLLLRPDSELAVERLSRAQRTVGTALRLDRGGADSTLPAASAASAARRYEIRTPTARLGARGTEFRTHAGEQASRVEVLAGRVAASSGPRGQDIDAGFGARLAGPGWQAVRLAPPPDLAGVATRVERLPLSFTLRADGPLRAEVFEATDPPRLRLAGRFDGGALRWLDDLPDGRYELRVRRIGEGELEGLDARVGFVLKARPEPPFISAPTPGAQVTEPRVRFVWTLPSGVARVRLQVADDADFASPRIDRADLEGSQTTVSLPLGLHHWRIASVRADGDQGPFSDVQQFVRAEPPPPPPPAPPNAQPPDVGRDGVRLRWAGDTASGLRWQVQLARDAAFTQMVGEYAADAPGLNLGELPAGTYHVRIRALAADGRAGPYGPPQQLDVPASRWWLWLLPLLLLL